MDVNRPQVRKVAGLLLLAVLGLSGCGGTRGVAPALESADHAAASRSLPAGGPAGRYIVVLNEGVPAANVAREHGATPEVAYDAAVNGFAGPLSPAQARGLQADPRVRRIEPDRMVSLVQPLGGPQPLAAAAGEVLPSGVNRVDAELSTTVASGVSIAIIDTGIDWTHPDLNVGALVSYVPGVKTGMDDNGHGTHVAGIAAARADGVGVRGVAPGARLVGVKVLDRNGSGFLSWIIKGIDYVTRNAATIKVANMSLGFQGTSPSLNDAIRKSVQQGVTYVVAAGNSGMDATAFSPANHPDVICVSAVADSDGACGADGPSTAYGADDTLASFSNFGSKVEIAAPGVSIYSTYRGGGYATMSGTSMAAPHVAGAAALYVARNAGNTPAQVRSALIAVATPQSPVEPVPDSTGRLRGGFSGDRDSYPEPLLDAGAL